MRRSLMVGLLVAVLPALLLPGCSVFVSSTQPVTIAASDPNAEIVVDGEYQGTGQVTVDLVRNEVHSVMARLGDRVGTAQVDYRFSFYGKLDIAGFFWLIPLTGLFFAGSRTLEPTHVDIALPPAAGS